MRSSEHQLILSLHSIGSRRSPPYSKPSLPPHCSGRLVAFQSVADGHVSTTDIRKQNLMWGHPAPRAGQTLNRGSHATTSDRWASVHQDPGLWRTSANCRRTHCAPGPARALCCPHWSGKMRQHHSNLLSRQRLACGTAGQQPECVWQLRGSDRSTRRADRISGRRMAVCGLASTLAPLYSWGSSLTEPLARVLVRVVRGICFVVGRWPNIE